jgi:hypothetical protein
MKRPFVRTLIALVGFAALAIAAKAQVVDQIVVTIPFEFVAAGKTLPAGTYKVNRVSNDRWTGLLLTSFENGTSVILHPTELETARDDNAHVSFQQAGDQRFLSRIETAENVFNISIPRWEIQLASGKSHTRAVSGNASGAN